MSDSRRQQQSRQRTGERRRREWNTTGLHCGHRGVGNDEPQSTPPAPTHTPGGTLERADVYAERAAAGVELYHPADGRPCASVDLN